MELHAILRHWYSIEPRPTIDNFILTACCYMLKNESKTDSKIHWTTHVMCAHVKEVLIKV